jgi:hypothetical protein
MQQLNEKRDVIIRILNRLREFNPAIGEYDRSIINSDFQYAVKLHNGRINLSQELVHDFEQSPGFVGEEQLKAAASVFSPGLNAADVKPVSSASSAIPNSIPVEMTKGVKTSSSSKSLLIVVVLVVLGLGGYYLYAQIDKEKDESDKFNIRNNITDHVTVETNNYQYYSLGGIVNLQVTVRNTTQYTLDNVKVEISYIKKNGGVWKNEVVETDMIGPQTYMTIKPPDTGRGTSVRCRIISVKSELFGIIV